MKIKFKQIFLLLLIVLAIGIIVVMNKNPIPTKADTIRIVNGRTGEELVLEGKNKDDLLQELSTMKPSFKGINTYSMGYTYKLIFSTDGKESKLVFQDANHFSTSLFKYTTESDAVEMIEKLLKRIQP